MRQILRQPASIAAAVIIAVVLLAGLLWISGTLKPGGCPSRGNFNLTWFGTPGGGAGHQAFRGISATPRSSPTAPPVPVLSGGHIQLTFANNRTTIAVPVGTIVDVSLASGPWGVPVSSDSRALARISNSSSCDGSVRASFRVQGSGWIEAHTDEGGSHLGTPDISFRVTVVAAA